MVASVYGTCDGHNIIFTRRGDTDLWDIDVPFDRDGNYVVSLYAIDDAGNESYYATVLFTVKRFCISVKILEINANADVDLRIDNVDQSAFWCTAQPFKYVSGFSDVVMLIPQISKYNLHAVRCERCGGV